MVTDERILELIQKGLLYVDFPSLMVYKFHNSKRRFYTLSAREHPKSGRINFNLKIKNEQRTIYRNKLVWMMTHGRVVPDGHCVDHIDGDRLNDHPENLRLQAKGESHRQGFDVQQDKAMDEWDEWWDHVWFWGKPWD